MLLVIRCLYMSVVLQRAARLRRGRAAVAGAPTARRTRCPHYGILVWPEKINYFVNLLTIRNYMFAIF